METIKTSEALEAQILEEAQARARRIREDAQKEGESVRQESERRTAEEIQRMEAAHAARLAELHRDSEASLRLEFKRLRLRFLERQVSGALDAVLASLTPEELHQVLGGQVAAAASAFSGLPVVLRCAGIDPAAARRIAEENLPGVDIRDALPLGAREGSEAGRGLIVEAADGSRRLRATLRELADRLLEERRESLMKALLGDGVPS